jgi:hypothetical protein
MPLYGKIGCLMDMIDLNEVPAPPRLIPALVAGFDAITTHILVILFPISVDILIWFAPHLRIKFLVENFIGEMSALSAIEGAELSEMIGVGQEAWLQVAEQFNLATAIRSYPVGIPSLMASSMPVDTPLGIPEMVEIRSFGAVFVISILFIGLGLIIGTLYYLIIVHIALSGKLLWEDVFRKLVRSSLHVFLVALSWLFFFIVISIPVSCLLSLAGLIGFSLGPIGFLLYGGFMIWLIFPLIFSAHGIFVKDLSAWHSIRLGVQITNATLPTTALFFLSAFILSQGLNLLWRIPPTDSWLTLLGIAGHAFVVSGLLAASFIYFRDADRWVTSLRKQIFHTVELDIKN